MLSIPPQQGGNVIHGPGALLAAMGYMEGQPLYNAFNMNRACVIAGGCAIEHNTTVINASVSTFLCPSDADGTASYPNGTNYGPSLGPQNRWDYINNNGVGGGGTGMFAVQQTWGLADCLDGSSVTVLIGEVLKSDDDETNISSKFYRMIRWPSGTGGGSGTLSDQLPQHPAGYANLQQYIGICNAERASRPLPQPAGSLSNFAHSFWIMGRCGHSGNFTMLLPPNSRNADCASDVPTAGMYTSRSKHAGGINALFADGSIHFIKDSISSQVWWALGTKAGGEVLSSDSY